MNSGVKLDLLWKACPLVGIDYLRVSLQFSPLILFWYEPFSMALTAIEQGSTWKFASLTTREDKALWPQQSPWTLMFWVTTGLSVCLRRLLGKKKVQSIFSYWKWQKIFKKMIIRIGRPKNNGRKLFSISILIEAKLSVPGSSGVLWRKVLVAPSRCIIMCLSY